jgi:hypothetical protein
MSLRRSLVASCIAGVLAALAPAIAACEEKVPRVVLHADLRVLDPISGPSGRVIAAPLLTESCRELGLAVVEGLPH